MLPNVLGRDSTLRGRRIDEIGVYQRGLGGKKISHLAGMSLFSVNCSHRDAFLSLKGSLLLIKATPKCLKF